MSGPGRDAHVRRLRDEAFDVVVVGGGISGAAVAREASRRGLRTALVEARDFAEGTSSRSSRLIHGGLRYLEHFEFDLVFEASQERRTLLRIAPHLVRPLEFFFPIYEGGRVGRVKLDAGMWLYDALSLFRNIERHQMLSAQEVLAREPGLRTEGLLGGARYFDAQVDDARLVVATVLAAAAEGAAVANRVRAVDVDASDWPGHRVEVEDAEGGGRWHVDALAVVLAVGPWTDRVLERTGLRRRPDLVRPSRGTHIHVRRERLGHERALIFESGLDGRVMFVLPWRDLTLIGTTDDFDERAPETVASEPADVRYLLESVNGLFPRAALRPDDVLAAWAGLRPLAAAPEREAPQPGAGADGPILQRVGAVSRDHAVHESHDGIFTLTGGKLTSHRALGEEVVDRLVPFLRRAGVRPVRASDTHRVPLPGGDFGDLDALLEHVEKRAGDLGVAPEGGRRLARAYGTGADEVLDLIRDEPRLARPIVSGRPHVRAEIVHAALAEMALHAEDVAYRRTRIGLETREGVEEAAAAISDWMGETLGWDEDRRARERERVLAVRAPDDASIEALDGRSGDRSAGERSA